MIMESNGDGLDELRRVRDAALESDTGNETVDAYERGAITMAWNKIAGQRPTLTDTLRVRLLGAADIDSYTVGTVSRAVQNAVAKVDRARRLPNSTTTTVDRVDRARAEIVQQAQIGNTMIFRVPAVPPADGGYDIGPQPARGGAALRELIETLPQTEEDDAAVDGILGSPQLIRLAVQDISRAAKLSPAGITMDLQTAAEEIRSVLTHDRAQRLDEFLANKDIREATDKITGRLDGLRYSRRVFFLVADDGKEISGSVDPELLSRVRELATSRVIAHLATTQWKTNSGRYGPKHYRLLRLELPAHQSTIDEEIAESDG
jgi:hypothetical protein